ncbi:MAG: hypothetical protein MJK04_00825 [Psychrosphaera sp.]|nr:hypothetical protein [Psychrosphaera sp.]
MNKIKKTLVAVGLGLGLGLSGTIANALPSNGSCANFARLCALGDQIACDLYSQTACWFCDHNPDALTCKD